MWNHKRMQSQPTNHSGSIFLWCLLKLTSDLCEVDIVPVLHPANHDTESRSCAPHIVPRGHERTWPSLVCSLCLPKNNSVNLNWWWCCRLGVIIFVFVFQTLSSWLNFLFYSEHKALQAKWVFLMIRDAWKDFSFHAWTHQIMLLNCNQPVFFMTFCVCAPPPAPSFPPYSQLDTSEIQLADHSTARQSTVL